MTVIPLGTPRAWVVVMEAAGHYCQCTGSCGVAHDGLRGQCRNSAEDGPLLAAPADLLLSVAAAACVPTAELLAWCTGCHRKAASRQRRDARERARLEDTEPDVLFDL